MFYSEHDTKGGKTESNFFKIWKEISIPTVFTHIQYSALNFDKSNEAEE